MKNPQKIRDSIIKDRAFSFDRELGKKSKSPRNKNTGIEERIVGLLNDNAERKSDGR